MHNEKSKCSGKNPPLSCSHGSRHRIDTKLCLFWYFFYFSLFSWSWWLSLLLSWLLLFKGDMETSAQTHGIPVEQAAANNKKYPTYYATTMSMFIANAERTHKHTLHSLHTLMQEQRWGLNEKKKNKKYENEKCARRMYSSECFQSQIAECSLVGLQWVYLCLWVTCFVILFLIFVLPVIRCCWSSTFCCCCSSFAYSCVSSFFPALFAPFLC